MINLLIILTKHLESKKKKKNTTNNNFRIKTVTKKKDFHVTQMIREWHDKGKLMLS